MTTVYFYSIYLSKHPSNHVSLLYEHSIGVSNNLSLDLLELSNSALVGVLNSTVRERSRADGVLKTSLASELLALLGSGSTTNDGILAIEVTGHFFEGSVLGFDVDWDDVSGWNRSIRV